MPQENAIMTSNEMPADPHLEDGNGQTASPQAARHAPALKPRPADDVDRTDSSSTFVDICRHGVPPRSGLFVLTCMDPRLDPLNFGVDPASAYVCRNAGGRAHEALRSIVVSQQYLGTNKIMVVHHTDCGMTKFTDQDVRDKLERELNADATHIAFLGMKTPWESVKLDVQLLRDSPLVRDVPISGYVYDVDSKRLHEVC